MGEAAIVTSAIADLHRFAAGPPPGLKTLLHGSGLGPHRCAARLELADLAAQESDGRKAQAK